MKYLFGNFLEDQNVYLQNEEYYNNLFKKITGHKPKSYYNTKYANGDKFLNGNPIFSTKYNNRLIRIIQDEPESDGPYLYARIEEKDDRTYELVINLELSKEIELKLADYLKKWFKEKVSPKEMGQIFKSYDIQKEEASHQEVIKESEIIYQKKEDLSNAAQLIG